MKLSVGRKEVMIPKKWRGAGGEVRHLVNLFKDGDNNMVVYKAWSKSNKAWSYKIEHKCIVEDTIKWVSCLESRKGMGVKE